MRLRLFGISLDFGFGFWVFWGIVSSNEPDERRLSFLSIPHNLLRYSNVNPTRYTFSSRNNVTRLARAGRERAFAFTLCPR